MEDSVVPAREKCDTRTRGYGKDDQHLTVQTPVILTASMEPDFEGIANPSPVAKHTGPANQ